MKPVTTEIEFFTFDELKCKTTGIVKLDPRFAAALPVLRSAWGKPLTLNSVCRSPAHNAKIGGHPNSFHMTENPNWPTFGTLAADVSWRDWTTADRIAFAKLAWSMGWSIGLHNGFCHVDRRKDLGLSELPQHIFIYGVWSGAFGSAEIRS